MNFRVATRPPTPTKLLHTTRPTLPKGSRFCPMGSGVEYRPIMGSRFWLYRTIITTVVRSHTAKHHSHVDCSKSAQHLASPEVCHVCEKNMSKPDTGPANCHKAARLSAERSRGDFHHTRLTCRKHFRSVMPRMIFGFTSSFDVGELTTWILSMETSGWLSEFSNTRLYNTLR